MPADDARAQRALAIIDSSLARLLGLVTQAQNFDRSTADLIEAPRVPVGVALVVGEAALHFREIWADRDIRMVRRLDETARVRAGRGMLETVLQNVLENATSFSPRGGTITVTLSQTASHVELQVEDEGPGIAPDRIGRIFERYYSTRPREGEAATGAPGSHAGLGLWIVRQHVEALGGTVSAVNRPTGGLSILIRLPRARR
jgi:two-component system sensor histidine kinase ChvG